MRLRRVLFPMVVTLMGGSCLQASAAKHRVFTDLFNLSTFLIPVRLLPPLPKELETMMSFAYELEVGKQ